MITLYREEMEQSSDQDYEVASDRSGIGPRSLTPNCTFTSAEGLAFHEGPKFRNLTLIYGWQGPNITSDSLPNWMVRALVHLGHVGVGDGGGERWDSLRG